MADVLIQHTKSEEAEEANQIKDKITSISSLSVEIRNTDSVSWSNYDGVIVLGGHIVNPVYDEMTMELGWIQLIEPQNAVERFNQTAIITEIGEFNSTVVQGIAGWDAEDTDIAVDAYTNESDRISYFIGSSIDEFIDQVRMKTGEEVNEPTDDPFAPNPDQDPATDPDFDGPAVTFDNDIRFELQESGALGLLSTEVSLSVSEGMSSEDNTLQNVNNTSFELGSLPDHREFRFAGKITGLEANKDLFITLNGRRLLFKADQGKFVMPKGPFGFPIGKGYQVVSLIDDDLVSKSLQESAVNAGDEETGLLEDLVDAFQNPTGSVENGVQVVLVLLVAILALRTLSTGDKLFY